MIKLTKLCSYEQANKVFQSFALLFFVVFLYFIWMSYSFTEWIFLFFTTVEVPEGLSLQALPMND